MCGYSEYLLRVPTGDLLQVAHFVKQMSWY